MSKEPDIGDKIQYRLFSKKGKEHWLPGTIHGVKRAETSDGVIVRVTYLIDTGRNERLDKLVYDARDREISTRLQAEIGDNQNLTVTLKELAKILRKDDLPASEFLTEISRQPEQIELTAEHIRQT